MSETLPFSSCFKLLSSTTRTVPVITRQLQFTNLNGVSIKREFWGCQLPRKSHLIGDKINGCRAEASLQEVNGVDDSPVSVDLEPICSEMQFDGVIAQAQRLEESIIVVWVARWCRKCIYLKPKLEKLAAEYYPRLRFYCVDVNNVPHKLVARAGVTRMPTIQLWKDGKKQAEVIGGHKAYLVINEVREMIENESNTDL